MPFAEVDEGTLYYETAGDGPWIVLMHGAWASHRWWRWQTPELSRWYRVLTFDARGHGLSTSLERPSSVNMFAQDLHALLDHLAIEECALMGWSMGGLTGIQYCLDYKDRVRALVLIATRGHRHPAMKRRLMFEHLRARVNLLRELAAPRKYDWGTQEFPDQRRRVDSELTDMLTPSTPGEVVDWIRNEIVTNPGRNFYEVAKSIWDWGAGDRLKEITVPTLVMVGKEDSRTPPSMAQRLSKEIPGSRLVVVEQAGHCLPQERPDIVNHEIVAFLRSIPYI